MAYVVLTDNFPEVAAAFGRAAETATAAATEQLALAAERINVAGTAIFMAHTPVGEEREGETEHLRDTAGGTVTPLSLTGAAITWRETKTIMIGGHGYPLARLLDEGRRGGYEVLPTGNPDSPNYRPDGPKALFWPGLEHPVGASHPGPAAPNPYIAEATAEVLPMARMELAATGSAIAKRVVLAMH